MIAYQAKRDRWVCHLIDTPTHVVQLQQWVVLESTRRSNHVIPFTEDQEKEISK